MAEYGDALKQAEQTVRERVSAGLPKSVFRGVSWQAHSQRPGHSGIWAAKIRCPTTNKLLCLGVLLTNMQLLRHLTKPRAGCGDIEQ